MASTGADSISDDAGQLLVVEETMNYEDIISVINDSIQDIGMGRYQRGLFFVTGFGYFADNLWPTVTSLILLAVVKEFHFQAPFLKLAQNVGVLVGVIFWGVGADIWGRRISFNVTLLITAVFALAAGGATNFVSLSVLISLWSVGVGGNLPVDSAIFLEFLPASHQYLLTVLSIWWPLGQLIASLAAWPLIAGFSCPATPDPTACPRALNMGWRYFLFSTGALMLFLWSIRFFLFTLHESPKFLAGVGRHAEAVEVLRKVALYNGLEVTVSAEYLGMIERSRIAKRKDMKSLGTLAVGHGKHHSAWFAVRRQLQTVAWNHVKPLFATPKLAYSTSLLIAQWALIGLAFPLYKSFITYYLATRGAEFGDGSVYITYRNQVILSVIGVPGALLAGYMIELPIIGRRGSLCISTVLTGVFILCSTTARSSNALLGWNCAYSFTSNIMYGVLYAVTPELFSTKHRGTGNAITASANRIFGVMAPVVALYANLTTSTPIFISGALFIVSGCLAILLPYESRGTAAL